MAHSNLEVIFDLSSFEALMKLSHSVPFIQALIHRRLIVSGIVLGDGNDKVQGPQGAGSHTVRVRCG